LGSLLFTPRKIAGETDEENAIGVTEWPFAASIALVWAGALVMHAAFGMKPSGPAAAAFLNTQLGAAGGLVAAAAISGLFAGRGPSPPPLLGAAAGLSAVSTGCGLMAAQSALIVGIVGGAAARFVSAARTGRASGSPAWLIFAYLGLPAALGMVLTGVFASSNMGALTWNGSLIAGLLSGASDLLVDQIVAAAALSAAACVGTALLVLVFRSVTNRIDSKRAAASGPSSELP
jgi:Amt family ammonium transporter